MDGSSRESISMEDLYGAADAVPRRASGGASQPAGNRALASKVWNGALQHTLLKMIALEDKVQVRCTCRSEKTRNTDNVLLEQILRRVFARHTQTRRPPRYMTADERYEQCLQVALPQRQAQLARKASRGEVAAGQLDVVLTDTDMREIWEQWREDYRTWMTSAAWHHYELILHSATGYDYRRRRHVLRTQFNTFISQRTGGDKVLLSLILRFDVRCATQPALILPALLHACRQIAAHYAARRTASSSSPADEPQRSVT